MSYVAKGEKDFEAAGGVAPKSHKIRITLTSRNVKNLEKGTSRTGVEEWRRRGG